MTIDEGIKRMQQLAVQSKNGVSVVLDPPLFDAFDIKTVPTVARVSERVPEFNVEADPSTKKEREFGKMLAKVEGLNNDEWLIDEIKKGKRGDLGKQGETYPIAEPDLIEVMKKRLATIDWEKKKEAAVKRFWKNQKFHEFATVETSRLREIDPTIIVKQDLLDLAGNPIRKAGEQVNPLTIRPFTQTVIVFNPLSKEEISLVKGFREEYTKAGGTNVVLIATQMEKENGWDAYEALTSELDAHVFVLTPEVEYLWHIEKTPSIITADNKRHVFQVVELKAQRTDDEVKKMSAFAEYSKLLKEGK